MKPSAKDKARYLAKIEEWKNLGFDVSGLAELLDSDFEMFKKRRLEILRGQIGDTPKKIRIEEEVEEEVEEPSEPYEKEVEEEVEEEEAEDESTILVGAPVRKARPKVRTEKEDKLMLVGKPLPVEPPPPEDEETILIGDLEEEEEVKPKKVKEEIREPKVSDAARVRELEAVEEPREKKREAEEEEEVEKEEEEEEAEVPMSMLGLEVPTEKKS
ncbi:MAG: hypothetical protein JSV49_00810 [Thermoplasmata archaeon]|nr:MAG: hypothetical protein JSV49_00810 [Thermoplasmata archaeon]